MLSSSTGVNEAKFGCNHDHRWVNGSKSEGTGVTQGHGVQAGDNGVMQRSMRKNLKGIRVTEGSMRSTLKRMSSHEVMRGKVAICGVRQG